MSVSLLLYGTNTASTTLSTACTMVTGTGGTVTSRTTTIGTKSGFGQLWSQPGGVWPTTRQSTIGDPDGHGWLYDTMDLESASIVSGVWTAKLQLAKSSTAPLVGDLYVVWSLYNTNSDTYTLITQAVQTGIAFSTAQTLYTLSSGTMGRVTCGDGDMLYRGVWVNVTTPSTSTGQGLAVRMANSSTAGVAGAMETDTPGMERFRMIPCDAALSSGRVIPATAALQPPAGIRLISCDCALSLAQTATILCDCALIGPNVRTIPASCALLGTRTPTIIPAQMIPRVFGGTLVIPEHAATTLLMIPRIFGGTLLLPQPTHTIPIAAALSLTQTRTLPASCSLGSSARLIPVTAALKLTQTRTIQASASLAPSPFTRFPQTSRRTGLFPFTGRRTGVFPQTKRRES